MRKILLSLISVVALAALVACGSGSNGNNNTIIPAPPSSGNNAGFTNASLQGSYVFSASGATSNTLYATAGVFTADGAGNITSGTRDTVNDAGTQFQNESITGTYSVNQDGRGQAVLNGNSGQIIYRFVLQSPASAKLFQISNTGDANGRIQLQTGVPALSGTYIVRLDGEDSGKKPYGAIGGLTASGATLTGQIDENDNGLYSPQLTAAGPVSLAANGRGTLSYTTSTGTHNLLVYTVSPSHIELVSTDRNFFLHGYGDLQTTFAGSNAAFTGDQVFSLSGFDSNGAIIETGRLTLDGAGNVINAIEDYNDAGFYFDSVLFTGTYAVTPAATGRWSAGLIYTTNSSTLNLVGWQVSPQQSVVLATSLTTVPASNFSTLETGTMRAQTTGLTTANVSGNYAEDLSGLLVNNGNVESAGNFDADGAGNLSGTIDSQTPSSINTDITLSGNYSVAANGRSSGTLGSVPVHLYTVDADTIYLISTDPTRLYQGMMVKQQ